MNFLQHLCTNLKLDSCIANNHSIVKDYLFSRRFFIKIKLTKAETAMNHLF